MSSSRSMPLPSRSSESRVTSESPSGICQSAAFLVMRYQVHANGQTSYESLTGITYKSELGEFGEALMMLESI